MENLFLKKLRLVWNEWLIAIDPPDEDYYRNHAAWDEFEKLSDFVALVRSYDDQFDIEAIIELVLKAERRVDS